MGPGPPRVEEVGWGSKPKSLWAAVFVFIALRGERETGWGGLNATLTDAFLLLLQEPFIEAA